MDNAAAQSTEAAGPSRQASSSTELTWNGRPLPATTVVTVFLLASLAILVAGVALNYALTEGHWEVARETVSSAFGESPTYLTWTPYDITALAILLVALVGLGVGFMAAYEPTLSSRWFLASLALATLFLGAWVLHKAGFVPLDDELLFLVLGCVFAFVALCWSLASRTGNGPRMHFVRAAGFTLFGFYWATQAMRLYAAEEGDFVNAAFAGFAVFFFNYFAYQELLSIRRNEDPRALHWLSGAAFLTTGLYVATHKLQVVSEWLILTVAAQTTWLLQWFGQAVERDGGVPEGSLITYTETGPYGAFPIQIILACTAIQSVMIFVGGILALRPPRRGEGLSGKARYFENLRPTYQSRRFYALLLTIPLIYALNLLRNVIIIVLSADGSPAYFENHPGATSFFCGFTQCASTETGALYAPDAAFWFSHNIIGKGGSLVALVVIAFMVFQILPELYDSIVGLIDLKERRGPIERWFGARGRRGNGGIRATAPPEPPPLPTSQPEPLREA